MLGTLAPCARILLARTHANQHPHRANLLDQRPMDPNGVAEQSPAGYSS